MTHAELTAARQRLGLTQAQLAEILGITDRALRDIEAGRTARVKPLMAREVERLLSANKTA